MKNECKIIQDLLPNYIEKTTSEETNQFLENHIKTCSNCYKIYIAMKEELLIPYGLNDNKEVDYMKKFNKKIKSFKLWKILAFIVCSIFITLLCIILYRYLMLTRIYNLHLQTNKLTNVYYHAETTLNTIDFWKKDNILKRVENDTNVEKSGTFWRNLDTDEGLLILDSSKIYVYTPSGQPSENLPYGFIINYDTILKRLKLAINPFVVVKNVKYDNKNCYSLNFNGNDFFDNTVEFYEKNTGLLLFESGHSQFINSQESINYEAKYTYKLDVVSDEDVEKPDLSEYELKN